jgi:ribonuclease VapC
MRDRRRFSARPRISRGLNELIAAARLAIALVTEHHAQLARQAYADFGERSGHPAGLNFGDCLSYALALVGRLSQVRM